MNRRLVIDSRPLRGHWLILADFGRRKARRNLVIDSLDPRLRQRLSQLRHGRHLYVLLVDDLALDHRVLVVALDVFLEIDHGIVALLNFRVLARDVD